MTEQDGQRERKRDAPKRRQQRCQRVLAREESRGAHYRTDFPNHNDAKFRKHSVVTGEKISFE